MIRPLGKIMLELEYRADEAMATHDLQWGDVLGLVYVWLMIHHPDARETYMDGTHPEFYYGPKREGDKNG